MVARKLGAVLFWSGMLVIALGAGGQSCQAGDRFLTLPHPQAYDGSMRIQQTWIYTSGQIHKGIDFIRGEPSQPDQWKSFTVKASAPGVVDSVGWSSSWGNYVIIKHTKNQFNPRLTSDYFTIYAHLERTYVTKGTSIGRGWNVGLAGKTEAANAVIHLHWEVHKGWVSNKVDPFNLYEKRDYYPGWPKYRTDSDKIRKEDEGTLFTTIPPRTP